MRFTMGWLGFSTMGGWGCLLWGAGFFAMGCTHSYGYSRLRLVVLLLVRYCSRFVMGCTHSYGYSRLRLVVLFSGNCNMCSNVS